MQPLGSCFQPLFGTICPSVHLKPKNPTRMESMLPAFGAGVAAGVGVAAGLGEAAGEGEAAGVGVAAGEGFTDGTGTGIVTTGRFAGEPTGVGRDGSSSVIVVQPPATTSKTSTDRRQSLMGTLRQHLENT
ncbi:MAG: hypothetical protein DMF82_03135 [Acidobacteria bacterium]|nr:MAG: hypothetical protein DMF82_03135 [Acidobacteriota bacterium]